MNGAQTKRSSDLSSEPDAATGADKASVSAVNAIPSSAENRQSANAAEKPLDDVMLAMDVVDTLRRDSRLIERELAGVDQDALLVSRLRDIYAAQGIDVPDHILNEGVEALREDRFTYEPTPPSLARKIANIYVQRSKWARPLRLVLQICFLVALVYYCTVILPQSWEEDRIETEISETIPTALDKLHANINSLSDDEDLKASAQRIYKGGRAALKLRDLEQARADKKKLQTIYDTLNSEYLLRIVSGQNTTSGVWRIPDDNPNIRNYYIIVEPIDANGKTITLDVINEENNLPVSVSKFGVRVSPTIFDRISKDKQDDGIIQNNIIGRKDRGVMERQYNMPVLNGIITDW